MDVTAQLMFGSEIFTCILVLGASRKLCKERRIKVVRYICSFLFNNFAAYDVGGTVVTGNEVVHCIVLWLPEV